MKTNVHLTWLMILNLNEALAYAEVSLCIIYAYDGDAVTGEKNMLVPDQCPGPIDSSS
jgi:hypothetical protein